MQTGFLPVFAGCFDARKNTWENNFTFSTDSVTGDC